MTEIFNRRPWGARSIRMSSRALATLAAAATVGAMLPAFGTTAALAAAPSCTAIGGLKAYDILTPAHYFDSSHPSGTGGPLDDVTLTWSRTGAPNYDIQISPNEDFTNNLTVEVDKLATSTYEVPKPALSFAAYYWRVRETGSHCWSDDATQGDTTAQFDVGPAGGTLGFVASPSDAASTTEFPESALRFHWLPNAPEESQYQLQVYDAQTHALVGSCTTDHTSVTPSDNCLSAGALTRNLSYFWRLRALDTTGDGTGSKSTPATVSDGLFKDTYLSDSAVYVSDVAGPNANNDGPRAVSRGDTVTVTGAGFQAPIPKGTVLPDGTVAAATIYNTHVSVTGVGVKDTDVTFNSPTSVSFPVPAKSGGYGDVVVSTADNGSSVTSSYSKISVAAAISAMQDATPPAGTLRTFAWQPQPAFILDADPATSVTAPAPAAFLRPFAALQSLPSAAACTNAGTECVDTPTFHWTPTANAVGYRVSLFESTTTSAIASVDTRQVSYTPSQSLLDDQAFSPGIGSGPNYRLIVEPCDINRCGIDANGQLGFRKRSAPPVLTTPAVGAIVSAPDLTFTWADYVGTKTESSTGVATGTQLSDEAASYQIQVATDCSFTNAVTIPQGNVTEFVQSTIPTPTDGVYYWRVQSIDGTNDPLTFGDAPNRAAGCAGVRSFSVDRTAPTPAVSVGGNGAVTLSYTDASGLGSIGSAHLVDTSDGLDVPETLAAAGSSITMTPMPYLIPTHSYAVAVTTGATDTVGNQTPSTTLAAFSEPTAPTPSTTGDGASLKLHYDQPVRGLTADKVHLVDDTTNLDVASTVVIVDAQTAEVTAAAALASGRKYSLRLDPGITDVTGLLIATAGSVPGQITSPFPPGVTSAHSREGIYTVTVDQAVIGFTPDKVHLYTDSTNVDVPASVTVSGQTATVTAAVPLVPGESYGLRVDGGIVGLDHVAVPSGPIPGTFREATKEDSDKLTRNGHWGNRLARGSDNGSALVSGTGNPSLSGRFRSSVLTVAYCVGPMDGYLAISIDGKTVKTFNTRNAFTACGKKLTFRGLSGASQHTVTFKKTGKKGSAKGGSQVVIDYINAG